MTLPPASSIILIAPAGRSRSLVVAIPFVFPFLWMMSSGLQERQRDLRPAEPHPAQSGSWQNFVDVFTYQPFARQYFNSLYIALAVTALTLVVSSLAGYALARMRFAGAGLLMLFLLSALMVPEEVTIIPNFFLMRWLGLMDTHVPLILLPVFGPHGIMATFLMRQYFLALPKELEEAGKMDGLSRFGIWWRIALPMSRPALAAVAIITFLFSWNLFLEPLIFLSSLEIVHPAAGALQLHRPLRLAAVEPAACGDQPRGGADPGRLPDRAAPDHRKLRLSGVKG